MRRLFVYRFLLAASLIATTTLLAAAPAAALYITGSEHVSGSRFTTRYTDAGVSYGPFGWNFGYTRSFDGVQVTQDLQINFVFDAALGFTEAQRATYKAAVERNIEGIWNNKYHVADTANSQTFPLLVDVKTTGPTFDQTVRVHGGTGRADMSHWFVNDTASVNAHEFGHMLGLFDEYIGGAVDRYPNPTLTSTGLMGLGALSLTPEMFPRYYQQYLDYVGALNPDRQFHLNEFHMSAVPEPTTILLVSLGSGVAVLVRRRRPGRRAR